MSLFSYLNYDGSYESNILNSVRLMTGKERSIEELNKMLESGNGVYYLTGALKAVESPEEAEYMILDTRFPIMSAYRSQHEAELGDTVCICITKAGLTWQGGFVSSYKKLVEYICNKQGSTPKIKKACKTNISLYIAEMKRFMELNPQVMEDYLALENVDAEQNGIVEEKVESESVEESVAKKTTTTRKKVKAAAEDETDNEEKAVTKKATTTKKAATARKKSVVKRAPSVVAVHSEDKPIFIPDSVADYIKKYMLDENEFWTVDKIKVVLWRTILVALKDLDNGRKGSSVLKNEHLLINSGFIGDNYEYIILSGELFKNNEEHLIKNVAVVKGKDEMCNLGFKRDTEVPTIMETVTETVNNVDFTDRSKMTHCVEERGFRLGINVDELNTQTIRATVERIKASVEMSLALEKKGIKMLVPFCFFTGNGRIQYLAPVYLGMIPKLDEPDGAVIIGKHGGVWEIETAVDMNMALNNVVVLDKYVNTPWLAVSKANTY